MASDKTPSETKDARVIEVGGGSVTVQIAGGDTLRFPANQETEKWAASKLYLYVKMTISLAPSV